MSPPRHIVSLAGLLISNRGTRIILGWGVGGLASKKYCRKYDGCVHSRAVIRYLHLPVCAPNIRYGNVIASRVYVEVNRMVPLRAWRVASGRCGLGSRRVVGAAYLRRYTRGELGQRWFPVFGLVVSQKHEPTPFLEYAGGRWLCIRWPRTAHLMSCQEEDPYTVRTFTSTIQYGTVRYDTERHEENKSREYSVFGPRRGSDITKNVVGFIGFFTGKGGMGRKGKRKRKREGGERRGKERGKTKEGKNKGKNKGEPKERVLSTCQCSPYTSLRSITHTRRISIYRTQCQPVERELALFVALSVSKSYAHPQLPQLDRVKLAVNLKHTVAQCLLHATFPLRLKSSSHPQKHSLVN